MSCSVLQVRNFRLWFDLPFESGFFMVCDRFAFRYHGDWRGETQTVVSLLAFMHWLETGNLLLHTEAEEKLGRMRFR